MVQQLLGLIGLSSWPGTQNHLCVCQTTRHPCLLGPVDWEDASCCSHLTTSPTLHQLGLTTLVYPYTAHLSSSKCRAWMYICVKGWHPLLTSTHSVPSTSQFRQWLTSVGIGHARLNNNLPCSPTSLSLLLLHSLLFSHQYIVSLPGYWLSHCSDCNRRWRRKKIAIIQNTELRHIPEPN